MPPWYLVLRVVRYLKGAATPMEVARWPLAWLYHALAAEKAEGEAEEWHARHAENRWG